MQRTADRPALSFFHDFHTSPASDARSRPLSLILFSLGLMTLPAPYLRYFSSNAPTEGSLAVEPGWFQLWQPAEVEQLNRDYHVSEFAPGFLGFGSNGGGELLAFDSAARIFMLPMIGMSPEEARPVVDSWSEFVDKIEK